MPDKNVFCTSCRKNTSYTLQKIDYTTVIRDKEYTFRITTAVCSECGEEMSLPGLADRNVREIDAQYRAAEHIISLADIEKLMKLYNIGKAPLSLALGFGEITVTRYLEGQVPSKEYSDIMRRALGSPAFMKMRLEINKAKIADAAYKKAMKAADELESLLVSDRMLCVIAGIFDRLEEVTPLMLQKLLYFAQGISYALQGRPLFEENCEAWIHGPVYPEVYRMFREFSYDPIEDDRFALLEGREAELTPEESRILDLVTETFGLYGGKVLEKITHREEPWRVARKGYDDDAASRETITKESIRAYYEAVHARYGIDTAEGLRKYIADMLSVLKLA